MQLSAITKKFGEFVALDSITAEFEPGRVYILSGPNGAGKTTLLRIIAGLIHPSMGHVVFRTSRNVLGVMMQESYLYPDLTPRENLYFYARLYGVTEARVREVASITTLGPFFDHDVATLSHGQKQRTSLARALLNDPRILLLDEPFLGLDAASVDHLQKFLADFKKHGAMALIATHDMELVKGIADCSMVLADGKIKYFGEFE